MGDGWQVCLWCYATSATFAEGHQARAQGAKVGGYSARRCALGRVGLALQDGKRARLQAAMGGVSIQKPVWQVPAVVYGYGIGGIMGLGSFKIRWWSKLQEAVGALIDLWRRARLRDDE